MILSDRDIKKALRSGRIVITPKPNLSEQLGTASLDLRLGFTFRVFKHRKVPFFDPRKPETLSGATEEVTISRSEPFILQPHEFVLASILEWVELPDDICARIDGRSGLGRLGLVIHSTAGHIDAGWRGAITLELSNIGMMPIMLYPRMRVCQLVFEPLSSPTDQPYAKKPGAKYHSQKSTRETSLGQERI